MLIAPRPMPTGVPPGPRERPPGDRLVPVWARLLAVVALAVAAFSAGRFTAPLQVEQREVDRVVYRDRVVERVVTVQAAARVETRIVYRDRVVTPDGTVTEHEIEKTAAKEQTTSVAEAERERATEGARESAREVVATVRPDWRVSVLAGASLQRPALPLVGPLVLGLEVDRRIVGGVSAGAWVNTVGAAGVAVSVEF